MLFSLLCPQFQSQNQLYPEMEGKAGIMSFCQQEKKLNQKENKQQQLKESRGRGGKRALDYF